MSATTAEYRRARLLTGPVLPTLLALAAPNVLLALMQALVSFADAWFIGRLGTEGLAGVALVFPIVILMQMMSAGAMGGGVSSAIARALGAGDVGRAERLALHAMVIAIAFGLLFTGVMMVAGPPLYRLLGGSGAVLSNATACSKVGLLSSFNALQTIAAAVIVTGLVGTFGTAALAGYGLGVRLELLQIPVVFAIGSALVVMVGTCIGAGDVKRARRIAWSGAGLAAGVTGSVGLIVALWPGVWAGLFSSDAAVLDAAYTYLRIAGWCYAFFGAGIALYSASQGAGEMLWPVLAGSARFVIAVAGGVVVLRYCNGTPTDTLRGLFAVIGFAMIAYGAGTVAAVKWGNWK